MLRYARRYVPPLLTVLVLISAIKYRAGSGTGSPSPDGARVPSSQTSMASGTAGELRPGAPAAASSPSTPGVGSSSPSVSAGGSSSPAGDASHDAGASSLTANTARAGGAASGQPAAPNAKWRRVEFEGGGGGASRFDEWLAPPYVMKRSRDFAGLPEAVHAALAAIDCRIPQYADDNAARHNLLRGDFDGNGITDLAVLCAVQRSAQGYVFWDSEATRRERLSFVYPGSTLTLASAADVDAHARPGAILTPEMPQTLDHDILEVGCCECCSSYFYRHAGRWFTAPGAD